MGRGTWNTIKQSKGFYVSIYRKAGRLLLVSIGINLFLGFIICYVHFRQPDPHFYATSGIVPPVELASRAAPNYSATALLPPDPPSNDNNKVIPQ